MLVILCSVFIVFSLSFVYLTFNYDYWKKRNVPYTKPHLFFGNMKDALVGSKHLGSVFTDLYRQHPTAAWVGYWKLREPAVLIRDLDLLRKVFISEFSSFAANEFKRDTQIDPIRAYNPFPLRGEEWKKSRTHLITNVAKNKMKVYFESMLKVSERTIDFLNKGIKDGGQNYVEHDTRILAGKYTIDVIAMAIFTVENNTFECNDNIFTQIGNNIFFNNVVDNVKLLMMSLWPELSKLLRLKFLKDSTEKKLMELVSNIMKQREEEKFTRNDFFQQMLKYRQNDTKNFVTDTYIASHAYGFIADGTETPNYLIGYTLYELAWNPHVQDKLRSEINEVWKKAGEVLDYEDLLNMKYMDMVTFETLRRHPPGFSFTKETTKRVEIPPPMPGCTEPVVLLPGTAVSIPVQAIHTDPLIYPDPYKYDPERFTPSAIKNRHEMAFLGLGSGPRNCPGSRYGLTQAKTLLFTVLREFEVRPSPRTPEYPTMYDPCTFITRPINGAFVKFIPLQKNNTMK